MKKTVHITAPDKIGTIAPEIYGHFSEHIGGVFYGGIWVGKDSKIPNIGGFRKDFIEKFKKIKPPVLRWPGGCFAEVYNWRDGIGKNRPTRINWWTVNDGRYEPNEVGTHEFMELCEILETKPYLAVNVTSITPMEARDWLDYCLSPRGSTTLAKLREENGHAEPFDIPYFGVGNENWGDGGNMTPEYYALEFRRFATVMGNVPSANKRSMICGGANGGDYNWTRKLAESLSTTRRTLQDGMSIHYYCWKAGDAIGFTEEQWYEMLTRAYKMDDIINRHYAILEGYKTENSMKLVIDEWGCWHPDGSGPSEGYNLFEQQSTMRDALVSAITLNIFNNQCKKIKMANVAQVCNNLHALFLADENHLITTPTYHVFDMFKGHQGGEALRAFAEDNEDIEKRLSLSASVKDGVMTLTLANCSATEDIEASLNLMGAKFDGALEVALLEGEQLNSHNTFDAPDMVTPKYFTLDAGTEAVTVPKASVVCITAKIK